MRFTTTLLALAALVSSATARSSTGDRVLVVRDKKYDSGYNKFFESLKDRGYELTFSEPNSNKATIEAFGVSMYDHLIVFAPEATSFHANLSPKNLLAAQAEYLNTLYVLSPSLDGNQAALLREYDIEPMAGTLYDAFSHVGGGDETDVVLPSSSFKAAPAPVLPNVKNAVVYGKGTGFLTGQNPFLVDVATAPDTSYLGDKDAKPLASAKPGHTVRLAGDKVALVAAMQTRENTRIGFIGSVEIFNDQWWRKELDGVETGNRAFLTDFSKWLFQETGVLRVDATHHHREGETEPLDEYTKKDIVNYEITISEHTTGANGSSAWVPSTLDDLQLEFTMLDPHYRLPLAKADVAGKYAAQFMAPDRHGVFKFVVNYFRPGYSFLGTADKASVVPLRHDQHPRFITGAFPFYTGALSTSAAFVLFVVIWINLGEADKKGKKATKAE